MIFKVTFKQLNNGMLTEFSPTITVYGETKIQVLRRLALTRKKLKLCNGKYKILHIEGK